jgi:hypothetical protein
MMGSEAQSKRPESKSIARLTSISEEIPHSHHPSVIYIDLSLRRLPTASIILSAGLSGPHGRRLFETDVARRGVEQQAQSTTWKQKESRELSYLSRLGLSCTSSTINRKLMRSIGRIS